jgi:hypothetical protein
LIEKYFWHFCWLPYLYTFSLYENASIYQLLLHMVFTSRNWFAMQGSVAIILISWNVNFIWETGYWTSFWRNSNSYEYKNKSARRGAQFVPIGMPTTCWNSVSPKETNMLQVYWWRFIYQ